MSSQEIQNGEPQVVTDSNGLNAQFVEIPIEGETIPVYCSFPQRGENLPLVLVIQEIFGIHEHIQDVCRRFAKQGCIALAPDLFIRHGNVLGLTEPEEIYPIVSQVPDHQVMQDLDACVDWAIETGLSNPQRMGMTGFCWEIESSGYTQHTTVQSKPVRPGMEDSKIRLLKINLDIPMNW